MKKVIKGSVYNTKTAKLIGEQNNQDTNHSLGTEVQTLKQLYRTKSGKYFFFIKNQFPTYIDVNNDDLNPNLQLQYVEDKKIIPVSYKEAVHFASEIIGVYPSLKEKLGKFFPELVENIEKKSKKFQKKIHLTEKASWYLEMMVAESEETNSSFIENLIIAEYQSLYKKEIMNNDPFHELERSSEEK